MAQINIIFWLGQCDDVIIEGKQYYSYIKNTRAYTSKHVAISDDWNMKLLLRYSNRYFLKDGSLIAFKFPLSYAATCNIKKLTLGYMHPQCSLPVIFRGNSHF